MFGGLYVPPNKITLPTQQALGRLPIIEAIAVDPEDPYEVDDSFAISSRPNHPLEVCVPLARGGLIPYTSDEFQQAFERLWSVYTSDEPGTISTGYRPMIDDPELVLDNLSLTSGDQLKPALALCFKLARSSGRSFGYEAKPVAVRTTQKTYQQFGQELLAGKHLDTLLAVNAMRHFRRRRALRINYSQMAERSGSDYSPVELFARKVVQELMVHTNKGFGELAERDLPHPRRVTRTISVDGSGRRISPANSAAAPVTRAYYSSQRGTHQPLETKDYTHTTSPLRRFADLLAHQIWEARTVHQIDPAQIQTDPLAKIIRHINRQIDRQAIKIGRDF